MPGKDKGKITITDVALVKSPKCEKCDEPMTGYGQQWLCKNAFRCERFNLPTNVKGVYPFKVVGNE